MDSALECLTFALNALGWAAVPSGFLDVTNSKALKDISPINILGVASEPGRRGVPPKPGYAQVFPTLQAEWQAQRQMIDRIRDLHDVSKHRQTIYVGGQGRLDPPAGFFESLGITEESSTVFHPEAEIILEPTKSLERQALLRRHRELQGQDRID